MAWFAFGAQLVDIALGLLAGGAASALDPSRFPGEHALAAVAAAVVATYRLRAMGTYGEWRVLVGPPRLAQLVLAVLAGAATAAFVLWLTQPDGQWLAWPAMWAVAAVALCGGASLVRHAVGGYGCGTGRLGCRIALVGDLPAAALAQAPWPLRPGLEVLGPFRDGAGSRAATDEPHGGDGLPGLDDLLRLTRSTRIDAIVLDIPLLQEERLDRVRAALRCVPADILLAVQVRSSKLRPGLDELFSRPLVRLDARPLDDAQRLQKAVFDRCVGTLLFLAASPVLLLVALLVRLDSPGPALFRQPRQGLNGGMFTILKFRTMFHEQADLLANRQTRRGDPRITRVGRVLRRLSLDELPQLWNVVRGDMSLVGPRPHAPHTKAGEVLFHEAVADYALRHRMKPGITGWAQVNGWRGETQTLHQLQQRVTCDLHYIENWSLLFDIRILCLTVMRELVSRVAF